MHLRCRNPGTWLLLDLPAFRAARDSLVSSPRAERLRNIRQVRGIFTTYWPLSKEITCLRASARCCDAWRLPCSWDLT